LVGDISSGEIEVRKGARAPGFSEVHYIFKGLREPQLLPPNEKGLENLENRVQEGERPKELGKVGGDKKPSTGTRFHRRPSARCGIVSSERRGGGGSQKEGGNWKRDKVNNSGRLKVFSHEGY